MSSGSNKDDFDLVRAPSTLDNLGTMSGTPIAIASIKVSVFRNTPVQDYKSPQYDMTEFVGITDYHDIKIGDILSGIFTDDYLVKNMGDRGRINIALFLEKL